MRASIRAAATGLVLLSLGALPCMAAAQPTTAQASATAAGVSVDISGGYARLLFTAAAASGIGASIADGILTIQTAGAVTANADALAGQLAGYVSSARRDSDGTYRFALARPVTLQRSAAGNLIAIDLVPSTFAGMPPKLVEAPPPAAPTPAKPEELPVLKVRAGEYTNYTRLVFDWPHDVRYTARSAPGRMTLQFEGAARPDLSMVESRPHPWLKKLSWRRDGRFLVVDVDADPEAGFKHMRLGNRIALDIISPHSDASVYLQAAAAAPAPAPAAKETAKPAVEGPEPAVAAATPSAQLTRDGALLQFPAARGKPAAIFGRGPTTWIVLQEHEPIDAASLLAGITSLVEKAEAEQIGSATVLRLALKSPLIARVRETATALEVQFAAQSGPPPAPIVFTRQGANGLTTLVTTMPGARAALRLPDAEAGVTLLVVPARIGRAVLTAKQFVDLEALPSAAGLVVLPRADDVRVTVQDEIATFSRPRGLTLATASGVAPRPIVETAAEPQGTFLDLTQWSSGPASDVYQSLRDLRAAVANAREANANKARLRLAQYLLAQGLAPEALGEIALMRATDPKLVSDPQLLVMTGAAQFMMGRFADAKATLSPAVFDRDAHTALWRGLTATRLGEWLSARRHFQMATRVLRSYPQDWQARAQLARAEAGLAIGDLSTANDALDQLRIAPGDRKASEAEYYRARLLAAQGHINEATARLKALETAPNPPIAARAILARVNLQLDAKKIAPTSAAEELERLRFRWRGDDLELNTLRRLGALYIAQKRWREGLESLRIAATNFPVAELGRSAQDEMRQAFADLFLGGKADVLPPVEALSLYYDFIELTPVGRDGDEMIRRLSDRLVAVDLLGPAEELLQHQVDERLTGIARSAVATKLAGIYLADRRPKETLRVINDTRQTGLPEEMNSERRFLEARALAALKEYPSALDLIADEESIDAKILRAEIQWQAAQWSAAGTSAEELLGEAWQSDKQLTEIERHRLMRAAVAYALAGDDASLVRLRERFLPKMEKSPDAQSFALVTEDIDTNGMAIRELAKTLASVDTLQAFMQEFRNRAGTRAVAQN